MTESFHHRWINLLAAFVGLLLCVPIVAADVTRIDIKPAFDASSTDNATVLTLRDVALISGPLTEQLSSVVILDLRAAVSSGAPSRSIPLSDIRKALDASDVNWGRTELSGHTCVVTLPAKASQVSPRDTNPRTEAREPETVNIAAPPTVRTAIARRIGAMLNVANDDLRLKFEVADDDVLDTPIDTLRLDLQPTSNAASGRVPIHVTAFRDDRIAFSRLISATVLVRRTIAAATGPIDRGQRLTSEHIDVSEQWVSPATRPSTAPEAIEGFVASVRMQPGQVITDNAVAQPVVCKRGDIVFVHALSGTVSVKAKARALATARDGEIVQLKLDGSDRLFTARMDGVGRAVLVVQPDQAQNPSPETGGTEVAEQELSRSQPSSPPNAAPNSPSPRKPKPVHPLVKKNPR